MPSTQSSPRTCNTLPSIATRSTIEEAIGFGRTGERKANVPVVSSLERGLQYEIAARPMHPIEDLEAPMTDQIGQGHSPAPIDDDRADRSVKAAALGTFGANVPWRVDRADKIDASVGLLR